MHRGVWQDLESETKRDKSEEIPSELCKWPCNTTPSNLAAADSTPLALHLRTFLPNNLGPLTPFESILLAPHAPAICLKQVTHLPTSRRALLTTRSQLLDPLTAVLHNNDTNPPIMDHRRRASATASNGLLSRQLASITDTLVRASQRRDEEAERSRGSLKALTAAMTSVSLAGYAVSVSAGERRCGDEEKGDERVRGGGVREGGMVGGVEGEEAAEDAERIKAADEALRKAEREAAAAEDACKNETLDTSSERSYPLPPYCPADTPQALIDPCPRCEVAGPHL